MESLRYDIPVALFVFKRMETRCLDGMLAAKDYLYAYLPKNAWDKLKAMVKRG